MKPNLTQAEVNHLRRLLGWVRCEVGQTPDEIVSTMQQLAPKLPEPNADAKARLVEYHAQAAAVPKYVRAAVKALEKLLVKQQGTIVDVPLDLDLPVFSGPARPPRPETAKRMGALIGNEAHEKNEGDNDAAA